MKLKIKVKKHHIEAGGHGCFKCPIALAINDTEGCSDAFVGANSIHFTYYGARGYLFRTPNSAFAFITGYDGGLTGAPFEFELEGN